MPLAMMENGNIYTLHPDHLGTPQVITDQDQNIVWRADYEPFGQVNITTELVTNNLRFPGQYFDAESNLHYNYFRDYDPTTGRYIQSDPIELAGGFNTYGYVAANPLIKIDPLGLVVTGSWMKTPILNIQDYGIDDWKLVSPSWSWWGYVKFVRLYGHAAGYINVDVKCADMDNCKEWEIHDRIDVATSGHFDTGPNLYALAVGFRAGPVAGVGANVAITGVAALQAEHHYLGILRDKAGPIINAIRSQGPTAMCLLSVR